MSCLFNSFSYFLKLDSRSIRNKICDYLQENKPIIDGLDTKMILDMDRPNYIQRMRNMSTWGGAIEIQAACNIWNLSIIVHNIRDKTHKTIEFIPINNTQNKKIEITWSGGHYEPIRK
tara:strand:+ start:266 stop:619 length:354 start_codon:yes stop_codon:yes gene_type:complete